MLAKCAIRRSARRGSGGLAAARVLICGCGALGSAAADTLARAGVGRLRIVDRDFVEVTNLQRQVLFDEADAAEGLPKAVAAAAKLRRINSAIEIEPLVADVTAGNILTLCDRVDLIVDGTDNFETRFLLNEAALRSKIPWIYGGAIGATGQSMTILPGEPPCLRCVIPESPPPGAMPTCDTAGILASAIHVVAANPSLRGDQNSQRQSRCRESRIDRHRLVGKSLPAGRSVTVGRTRLSDVPRRRFPLALRPPWKSNGGALRPKRGATCGIDGRTVARRTSAKTRPRRPIDAKSLPSAAGDRRLHADALRRRPRDHRRHRRRGGCAQRVCQIRWHVRKPPVWHWPAQSASVGREGSLNRRNNVNVNLFLEARTQGQRKLPTRSRGRHWPTALASATRSEQCHKITWLSRARFPFGLPLP